MENCIVISLFIFFLFNMPCCILNCKSNQGIDRNVTFGWELWRAPVIQLLWRLKLGEIPGGKQMLRTPAMGQSVRVRSVDRSRPNKVNNLKDKMKNHKDTGTSEKIS
jgi:hypothetical protein